VKDTIECGVPLQNSSLLELSSCMRVAPCCTFFRTVKKIANYLEKETKLHPWNQLSTISSSSTTKKFDSWSSVRLVCLVQRRKKDFEANQDTRVFLISLDC
jgi:hypothetical protein